MLKVLRDNIKYLSWILWLVIVVFVAFVFVDFGTGLGAGQAGATAAVSVGDGAVSHKEFEREYRRLEAQYREAFGGRWTTEMAERMQLPAQALQRLVDRRLLVAEARHEGLRVGDEDVRRAILEFPALQDAAGHFVGEEEYHRFLRGFGFTAAEFERAMREDLLVERFSQLFTSGLVVADGDVERAWRERNERAAIRWLLAPTSRHLAAASPTAAEVESYYQSHPDEFRLGDQRVVDYLLVDVAKLRAAVAVDRAAVERAYADRRVEFELPEQVHARHILVKVDESRDAAAARAILAGARRRLARGESFETLARELSEDPGSRERGGDLGAFGRGQMVPPFEQAAFGAAVGEIVGPVETSFGLHLIEVLERQAARTRPLAEVEGALRAELAQERAASQAEAKAKELAARIAQDKLTGEEAWKGLGDGDTVLWLTTPAFARGDSVPGIGRNPQFTGAAFALAPGAASEPVEVARGWAVLRLREELAARLPALAEVEARVRAAAQREQANRLAAAELERARAALAGGRGLDEVAATLALELRDSDEFGRGATVPGLGNAPAVVAAAMELAEGALGGPLVVPQGAVLFEVTARTSFDPVRFAAEREALRAELREAEANRWLAALLARRREEARIVYDPVLLERLGLAGQLDQG